MEIITNDALTERLTNYAIRSKLNWDKGVALITLTSNHLLDTTIYGVADEAKFAAAVIERLEDCNAMIYDCVYHPTLGIMMLHCIAGESQDIITLKNMDKSIVDC